MDLFTQSPLESTKPTNMSHQMSPLAERMRPQNLDEFSGLSEHLSSSGFLRRVVEERQFPSLILWGPPGSGKTSLAQYLAESSLAEFSSLSAVMGGVKDLKEAAERARKNRLSGKKTLLFVDEIHRWNKSQQDALLPLVERGIITLIGATTENPSFELNAALLSRCHVVVLKRHDLESLKEILKRAIQDKTRGLGKQNIEITEDALELISQWSDGDARKALNLLESASLYLGTGGGTIDHVLFEKMEIKKVQGYQRGGEDHYDLVSALIKSMRGSDPDAALYYLARFLECGENPLFIARRLVIFASEDISNADPRALQLAVSVFQAVQLIGLPEAAINLAHGVTYLACAPKSNRSYIGLQEAQKAAQTFGKLSIPNQIKNAPTNLLKELGNSKGYLYPHQSSIGYVKADYLPEGLRDKVFYHPKEIGYEKKISEWMRYLKQQVK